MKCPNDQTEMEKYMLVPRTRSGGEIELVSTKAGIFAKETKTLRAFICPKCGKVELYTEPKKKEVE